MAPATYSNSAAALLSRVAGSSKIEADAKTLLTVSLSWATLHPRRSGNVQELRARVGSGKQGVRRMTSTLGVERIAIGDGVSAAGGSDSAGFTEISPSGGACLAPRRLDTAASAVRRACRSQPELQWRTPLRRSSFGGVPSLSRERLVRGIAARHPFFKCGAKHTKNASGVSDGELNVGFCCHAGKFKLCRHTGNLEWP